jgi:CRISPR-associated protein Csb2
VRYAPDPDGEHGLRVPDPGQRLALEEAYERHEGNLPGRVMPGRTARYRTDQAAARAASLRAGGRWFAWRLAAELALPLHRAGPLVAAVRGAILAHAPEPAHPALSGHDGAGPLAGEHLAILPLGFVGHAHADGLVRGFALSLPAEAETEAERALLAAIGRWEAAVDPSGEVGGEPVAALFIGGRRLLVERLVDEAEGLATLRRGRWARASARWATVTPIALDGECGPFDHAAAAQRRKAWKTAEKRVRRSAWYALAEEARARVDPAAIEVEITLDPPLVGAAALRGHPRFQRDGHERPRRLVHAVVRFPEPVAGPLVLGAGRHFGLGLCAPIPLGPTLEVP